MYKDVAQVDAIEPSLFKRTKSLKRIDRSTVPIQTYMEMEGKNKPDSGMDM